MSEVDRDTASERPEIGADEWVAPASTRSARARRAAGPLGPLGAGRSAPVAASCSAARRRRRRSSRSSSSSDYIIRVGGQHADLRAARARTERRRRLGRPARPRLRRVLRLRRLRATRCSRRASSTCHLPALRVGPVVDRRRGAARAPARPAVAAAARRLPRDRDALLRADLRRRSSTNADRITSPGTRATTSPAARTGSPTRPDQLLRLDARHRSAATSTSRSSSSPSSSWRCYSSTTRGPGAPGGRCARTRWPPS